MNLPTLSELGNKHGTDKGPKHHNYCEYYHSLLSPLRHEPIHMVEIGVDGGESIRMWSEFFTHPEAKIYGVDIHDKGVELGKGKFIFGDATNPNFIHDFGNGYGPFDFICDDGSHMVDQQKDTLRLLWPHLKPGGIWCTEDVHSSWHFPWCKPDEISFVHSMKDWIDNLMEKGAGHCGVPTETDIQQVLFRKSLVVIHKR